MNTDHSSAAAGISETFMEILVREKAPEQEICNEEKTNIPPLANANNSLAESLSLRVTLYRN